MANNLGGTVTKFTGNLDRIIEQETKTSFLNINGDMLGEFSGVGEVKLPTVVVQGLGDYDRANGFAPGDATVSWETYKLQYDRGREFVIDEMDDEEHLTLVSANVMAEFARTKVVPEVDAVRFARLAEGAGKKVTDATFDEASDAWDAVLDAEEHFENLGIGLDTLTLNLTAAMKTMLRNAMPWRFGNGDTPDTRFETFDGMRLNVIPQGRFYSAVELLDGKDAERAGGYRKAEGGKALNFLICAPGAAVALQKHEKLRYFGPDVYQAKDAHCWQYRLFHDLITYKNKRELIYASIAAA